MKIAVAMSGGVDSSVAAKILKDGGHDLVGLFLKLWSDPTSPPELRGASPICRRENRCCDYEALEDARKVAVMLDIPFYVINAKEQFKKGVVDYFLDEYKNLRTPNPCVVCNEKIKFDLLLKKALSIGCNYLATGHYARVTQKSKLKSQNYNSKLKNNNIAIEQSNNFSLLKGIDDSKDQSYMLYRLNQHQLSKVLLPLGEMKKSVVRKLAVKWDLPVKEKPESQEICFFADKDYRAFLRRYLDKKYFAPGEIVDANGNIIGKHDGLLNYTIGQRRLIDQRSCLPAGMAKIKNQKDKQPLYVIGFDAEKNQLIVGKDIEVYKKDMIVGNLNWIHRLFQYSAECQSNRKIKGLKVKIRYRHPEIPCEIKKTGNKLQVIFDKPQRAITPGQSAVFYSRDSSRGALAKWDQVIGGGVIES